MHQLGLDGMPRRIYTYSAETGWGTLNAVATWGQLINDLGMFLFVVNVVWSFFKGARASPDPWGAPTLEWAVSSPPPPYNFAEVPVVVSREPLWQPVNEGPRRVSGLSDKVREGLVTTVLDAIPDVRYVYPNPSIWPFIAALGVSLWLIWSIYSVKAFLYAMIPPAIAFIAWYWPREKDLQEELSLEKRP
jgi:hypothetical protein